MEIGFLKRQLAHGNVLGGVVRRFYRKSESVAENGEVVSVVVIWICDKGAYWECTNPWLSFMSLRNIRKN